MSRVEEAYRRSLRLRRGEESSAEPERATVPLTVLDRFPREGVTSPARVPDAHTPVASPSAVSGPNVVLPSDRSAEPAPVPLAWPQRHEPVGQDIPISERHSLSGGNLVTVGADPMATEQYSRLAASLHQAQVEQNLRTLMVTSARPREGKTLTAVNLALTLGELYNRRVLLVDADLRRPSIHTVLKLSNRVGLGEVLRSREMTIPLAHVTPRLAVLVGGRPDASPLADLASDRMRGVVSQGLAQFDWVILDTPPVGLLADASLVARWADGVLLVVGARSTSYLAIQETIELLGPNRVIGSVLNRSDRTVLDGELYDRYYRAPERTR